MPRELTPEERLELEVALDSVQMHQTAYWDALSDLERLLHNVDLDSTNDYDGYDVDNLLALEEDDEDKGHSQVCAECREPITSMNRVIQAKDGALFHQRCWNTR